MILPITSLVCVLFGDPLPPAITEPPRIVRADLARPSPRAKAERAQTLLLHKEWTHRIHVLRAEQEAKRAVDEAPAPVPQLMPASVGPSAVVNNYIVVGGSPAPLSPGGGQLAIPPSAGMLPPWWNAAYGPILRRFADSGL